MDRWRAVVAVVLSVAVAVTMMLIAAQLTFHSRSVTPEESTLLATIVGAALGVLGAYVGGRGGGGGSKDLRADRPAACKRRRWLQLLQFLGFGLGGAGPVWHGGPGVPSRGGAT
jgi:hypothetical protein